MRTPTSEHETAEERLDLPLAPAPPRLEEPAEPPQGGALLLDEVEEPSEAVEAILPGHRPRRRAGEWLALVALLALAAALTFFLKPDPALPRLSTPLLDFVEVRVGATSEPLTVTIANGGERRLELGGARVEGAAAGELAIADDGCAGRILRAGESCAVALAFSPASRGLRRAELVLERAPPAAPIRLPAIAYGVAPQLVVTPPALELGSQTVGMRGERAELAIENEGSSPLAVEGLAFEGLAAADFVIEDDGCAGAVLAPGETCRLRVVFVPTVVGERRATAWVRSDALEPPGAIALAGEGLARAARLSTDVERLDFGALPVAESAGRRVVLENAGTAPVAIGAVRVETGSGETGAGDDSGRFAVDATACSAAPLAPGTRCALEVAFRPDRQGAVAATLRVAHGGEGESLTIPLAGLGLTPGIRVRPALLDFGELPVGEHSGSSSLTLENTGMAPLNLAGVSIAGAGARAFDLADDECGDRALAPGERCRIAVRLRPRRAGEQAAELVIRHNAGDPERVPLRGVGLLSRLAVTPEGLDFGAVVRGERRELRLELISRGRAPLVVERLELVGGEARSFELLPSRCVSRSLAGGERCPVTLRFAPDSVGARDARLRIRHNGEGGSLDVPLIGRGAPPPRPQIVLEPESLDFGTQPVGERTDVYTLTVRNAGDGPLTLARITVDGVHGGDFQLVRGSCAPGARVDPGAVCTIGIVFRPLSHGHRGAGLTLSHDAAGGSDLVPLVGTGEAPPEPPPP